MGPEAKKRVLFLSDFRTFDHCDYLIEQIKPDFLFMLGDILADGPGQQCLIEEKLANELFKKNKVRRKWSRLKMGLKNGLEFAPALEFDGFQIGLETKYKQYFLIGNTHSSSVVRIVHTARFLELMNKVSKMDIHVVFVLGNHDERMDYIGLLAKNNINTTKMTFENGIIEITKEFRALTIDYAALTPKKRLEEVLGAHAVDMIATHASASDIRFLADYTHTRYIVSGHWGDMSYTYGKSEVFKLDSCPYVFLIFDIEGGRVKPKYGHFEPIRKEITIS